MRVTSDNGFAFIRREEGTRLKAYKDQTGSWTIGVGHLLHPVELSTGNLAIGDEVVKWKNGLSAAQVTALLYQDVGYRERTVSQLVTVPLNRNQFDSLVSFVFNVGSENFCASALLRVLNKGYTDAVPAEMKRWTFSKGVRLPVLVARREREAQLWRTPV